MRVEAGSLSVPEQSSTDALSYLRFEGKGPAKIKDTEVARAI